MGYICTYILLVLEQPILCEVKALFGNYSETNIKSSLDLAPTQHFFTTYKFLIWTTIKYSYEIN